MARRRYTVNYERGDRPGQWIASVVEVPGCHTYGRGLRQTRTRLREALALWLGEKAAERARLTEELPLPASARRDLQEIEELESELDRLDEVQERLTAKRRRVVRELALERGWSLRDIGQVVGLSFQRVEQLAKGR